MLVLLVFGDYRLCFITDDLTIIKVFELDMIVKTDGKEQLYEIKTSPKYMNKKGIVTYITMQDAWEYLL